MKSTNENQHIWERRIEERAKSGLSIAKWCENNGINKGQYHYWNKRLSKYSNNIGENTFAEITPILSNIEATM